MNISVFGSGYVGLVVAACFAEVGNEVLCMDVDEKKIAQLQQGKIPIYEPGLEGVIKAALASGHLRFTTNPKAAVEHAECIFIAVGTPPDENGKANMAYVYGVAEAIGEYLTCYKIIIDKSTVPIGTASKVKEIITQQLSLRGVDTPFDVVANPEFLREGSALNDFRNPDRIILGVDSVSAEKILKELYASFHHDDGRLIIMDTRSAELTKYAANAILATKISFMNEMANLAEKVGADIEKVRIGIGADPRIGYHFTHAGCGYGGSCFGKDIQSLIHTATDLQLPCDIIKAVHQTNLRQKRVLIHKIEQYFAQKLTHKVFAIWGVAFKPETNDIRDAPSLVVIAALLEKGARLQIHDPQAMEEAKAYFGDRSDMVYCATPEEALEGANALVILTEWRVFKSPDLQRMKEVMIEPVIFDGRNMYDPHLLEQMGIAYYGTGRGRSLAKDCLLGM